MGGDHRHHRGGRAERRAGRGPIAQTGARRRPPPRRGARGQRVLGRDPGRARGRRGGRGALAPARAGGLRRGGPRVGPRPALRPAAGLAGGHGGAGASPRRPPPPAPLSRAGARRVPPSPRGVSSLPFLGVARVAGLRIPRGTGLDPANLRKLALRPYQWPLVLRTTDGRLASAAALAEIPALAEALARPWGTATRAHQSGR